MYKKTRKLIAMCLTFAMLLTIVAFPSIASAATSTTLAGADRYATALKIVQNGWTKSDSVIIARGDDLADALAAAPLAYAKGKSPILLTEPGELPTGVLPELKSLGVKNVYIIGGTGAVSTSVENTLKNFTVIRIAGKDRADTSYKVALEAFGKSPTSAVIANGLAYADALSISSIAAVKGMPILLVTSNELSANEANYIAGKSVYAVGGTGVLSNVVVNAAKATRLSGIDRYETNAAILGRFAQNYSNIYLAKGTDENLVDALAGSALAALGNNPIVLVDGNSAINSKLADVVKANIGVGSTEVLLGGTVAQSAANAIESLKPKTLPVKSVSLNKSTDSLTAGEKDVLISTIEPTNATNQAITWTSSDNTIATVDTTGKVIAVSAGTTTITAITVDGSQKATCIVTVTNPVVTVISVNINKTTDVLTVGSTNTLSATVAPTNATNKAVTWTSSDNTIATVDNTGKVTAVIAGTATITATTVDGNKTDACAVTVNNPVVNVTSVGLNKTTDTLTLGSTDTLSATVSPSNATNQAVTWTSSDNTIATVDNTGIVTAVSTGIVTISATTDNTGKVTAISAGTAIITATTVDGSKTATCTVTVNNPIIKVTSVSLNKTTDSLIVGATDALLATINPTNTTNTTNKAIAWISSNPTVATVDSNGIVTAVSYGTATITASTTDGSNITATVNETVAPLNDNTNITSSFTDTNFKNIVYSLIHKSSPSSILYSDVKNLSILDISDRNISSLSGIEYFTNLTQLMCDDNPLSTIDVSKNTALTYLTCDNDQLTTIDISKNTALVTLDCTFNQLTSLDISNNAVLAQLDCSYNQLKNLDLSKNTVALAQLDCSYNQLGNLDVSNNTTISKLFCNDNQLTTLDISKNTQLTTLDCTFNQIATLYSITNTWGTVDYRPQYADLSHSTTTYNLTVSYPVTSIALNESKDVLTVGDIDTLTSTVGPNNATNQSVTWTSSDNSIVTVDNTGKLTAIGAGTATITVTTVDGSMTANCTVIVNNTIVNVISLNLNKATDTIAVIGGTDTLKANIAPNNASNQAVTWTSSNESIATVDNTGKVTTVGVGTATITATSVDGNKIDTCTLIVENNTREYVFIDKTTGVVIEGMSWSDNRNLPTEIVVPDNEEVIVVDANLEMDGNYTYDFDTSTFIKTSGN